MSETIALGGRRFALRPLRLGELRPLLDALDAMTGKSGGALIDAASALVHAGLAGANPELQPNEILDLEATIDELGSAVAAILRVAGLVPLGEAHPVASAGVTPGPSSALSMAPSPPDVVIPGLSSTP